MSTITKVTLAMCVAGFLGACAQQEEPAPVMEVMPTVDKMGNSTCPAGYKLGVKEESGMQVCVEDAM